MPKKDMDDISREEDFRDYEERNLDDGWPYADKPGAASAPVDNAPYGGSESDTATDQNPGFMVDEAGFDGMEPPQRDSLRPGTIGLEIADDLEERITETIDALGIIDMALIDVRVQGNTTTIEGEVDDAATGRRILAAVQTVAGVRNIRNHLRLSGVDSRIPSDD